MKISWHSLWERKRWQLFDHKNISGNFSLSLINTPLAARNASNNRSSRMWEFLLLQHVKKGVCRRMMSSDKLAWGSCWIQSDKYNNVPISHAPTRYHCGPPPLFPHCIFNPSFKGKSHNWDSIRVTSHVPWFLRHLAVAAINTNSATVQKLCSNFILYNTFRRTALTFTGNAVSASISSYRFFEIDICQL